MGYLAVAMKTCSECRQELPLSAFETTRDARGHVYPHSKCRDCRNAQRRATAAAYYKRNKAQCDARTNAARKRRKEQA